jgi:hypothetical protein
MMTSVSVHEYQRLETSGARGASTFTIGGKLFLAIPQLAEDIDNEQGNMNGGNSNVDSIIYLWHKGKFLEYQRIPSHGAEAISHFSIKSRNFIAIANIRYGSNPDFDLNTQSKLYEWDGHKFIHIQNFDTFAAKHCHAFSINNNHFLAFSEGITLEDNKNSNTCSNLYKWDGDKFELYESFLSKWGYGFHSFRIDDSHYLALADHIGESIIYIWNGNKFDYFQGFFPQGGGRSFCSFTHEKTLYLAIANLTSESTIYKWNGTEFSSLQKFKGKSGRSFSVFNYQNGLYLLRSNFISGSREAPNSMLDSLIYQWQGNGFIEVNSIVTYGATQMTPFEADGQSFIAVSNSLSKDLSFRVDSVIYRVTP